MGAFDSLVTKKFRFSQGSVVMLHFKFAITLFVVFSVLVINELFLGFVTSMIAMILVLALIPTWFSRYVLEIDVENRTYADLIQILSLSWGKKVAFGPVEKIFINECQVGQTIHRYSTGAPATFRSMEYKAFLKLQNGDKVFLLSKMEPERLKESIAGLASELQTDIIENY